MTGSFRTVITKLTASPRRLFLMDGLGALLTAFLSGIILPRFEAFFGMPRTVLYGLALLACVYVLWSFCCYLFTPSSWRPFLKAIILANTFYCCLIIGLVCYFFRELTVFGVAYFLLEIGVIAIIVRIELLGLAAQQNKTR